MILTCFLLQAQWNEFYENLKTLPGKKLNITKVETFTTSTVEHYSGQKIEEE